MHVSNHLTCMLLTPYSPTYSYCTLMYWYWSELLFECCSNVYLKKKFELDRAEADISEFVSVTFNSVTITLVFHLLLTLSCFCWLYAAFADSMLLLLTLCCFCWLYAALAHDAGRSDPVYCWHFSNSFIVSIFLVQLCVLSASVTICIYGTVYFSKIITFFHLPFSEPVVMTMIHYRYILKYRFQCFALALLVGLCSL